MSFKLNASEMQKSTNDAIEAKRLQVIRDCTKILIDLSNKIKEAADLGEGSCVLSLTKNLWPNATPKYPFAVLENYLKTAHGHYIYQQLSENGFQVTIKDSCISVSWLA